MNLVFIVYYYIASPSSNSSDILHSGSGIITGYQEHCREYSNGVV